MQKLTIKIQVIEWQSLGVTSSSARASLVLSQLIHMPCSATLIGHWLPDEQLDVVWSYSN